MTYEYYNNELEALITSPALIMTIILADKGKSREEIISIMEKYGVKLSHQEHFDIILKFYKENPMNMDLGRLAKTVANNISKFVDEGNL